jgi:hypothetical protein
MTANILAHEKWFIDPARYPIQPDHVLRPQAMAFIDGVLAITAIAGVVWWKRKRKELLAGPLRLGASPERMCGFYGLVPAILAIHLAVPLLVNGIQRTLFSVNNALHGAPGYFMGLAMVGCALSFFYGGLTRVAAVMLALLWVAGLFTSGIEPMLDNIHMLGFAAFFFCAGRGPIAIDRLIFPFLEPSPQLMARAVPLLRIGVGLGLIIVAFTEKLANTPMALAFLRQFPVNFTPKFGIPMSDETFILCAGAVELLVGLFLTFGIFQREIVLVAWVPINMSLSYFNWNAAELVGHLPIYGAMAVLLIWDPAGSHVPLWLRGLREGPLGIAQSPSPGART